MRKGSEGGESQKYRGQSGGGNEERGKLNAEWQRAEVQRAKCKVQSGTRNEE